MKQNHYCPKGTSEKRPSTIRSVFPVSQQHNYRRMSTFINNQRRLSLASQISSPRGAEYRPQQRLPPNGLESYHNILLTNVTPSIPENQKLLHSKPIKKSTTSRGRLLSQLCCVAVHENQYEHDFNKFGA